MDLSAVEHAFYRVLTGRLVGLAVYGSFVTGDAIPGFSDLDLLVVQRGPLSVEDAIELQRVMRSRSASHTSNRATRTSMLRNLAWCQTPSIS